MSKKIMLAVYGIIVACILNIVIDRVWLLYIIYSVSMMFILGRVFRNFEERIRIFKIASIVALAGLLVPVYIEARFDIINLLNEMARGDGFAVVVSAIVLGPIAMVLIFFTYTGIAALGAGIKLKDISNITID